MTQSLYVQKTINGVRIRRKIDSDDPERRTQDEVILRLIGKNHRGVLRMIADGTLSVRDAVEAFESGDMDGLPNPEEILPLDCAIERWIAGNDFAPTTECEYRKALGYVTRGQQRVSVGQIPQYLRQYREKCKREDKGPSFRIARSASMSLITFTFDRYHRLWRDCAKLSLLREIQKVKPHLSIEKVNEVGEALGNNAYIWYSMVYTGMLPSEYWGIWKVESDRIEIFGTKRVGRQRPVPLVYVPQAPQLTVGGFTNALKRTKLGITPKNGRDAFTQLALTAGIPRERVDMYLGHGPKSILDVYAMHEITPHLEPDAALLRNVSGIPAPKIRRAHLSIG